MEYFSTFFFLAFAAQLFQLFGNSEIPIINWGDYSLDIRVKVRESLNVFYILWIYVQFWHFWIIIRRLEVCFVLNVSYFHLIYSHNTLKCISKNAGSLTPLLAMHLYIPLLCRSTCSNVSVGPSDKCGDSCKSS